MWSWFRNLRSPSLAARVASRDLGLVWRPNRETGEHLEHYSPVDCVRDSLLAVHLWQAKTGDIISALAL
jgi:hypothetical protein